MHSKGRFGARQQPRVSMLGWLAEVAHGILRPLDVNGSMYAQCAKHGSRALRAGYVEHVARAQKRAARHA
jgi:hypothetical protein